MLRGRVRVNGLVFLVCFCFLHLFFFAPMGNVGRFPQGKPAATESPYPALINLSSACRVFSCFCNPQYSDMDYRVFNGAYAIILMRVYIYIYTHRGVGHADSESAYHF